ncbi:ATP synthase F1 subunit gamma [Catenisphaera adipataccumulans]|jgi:F-type H+-transporting ATPase subunit gamma|uniref:ATP synthase gamma chain n=1 Tax=Catenisphaera adipataccumulans TaxID=700500 RepID=A0A7W8FUA8_9FIRM|nr:ATP synthase F1 subunit gamma [Catenisphaera adipataccumulans]MBB5182394.1 F-type H+-transporting ATPase subunit gamma [Catenisphaera adipataccumulans]
MSQSRQAIKNRIRSVESTMKITRVMQLMASTELTRQRKTMEENREYAQGMAGLLNFALTHADKNNPFLQENEGKPSFIIVFTSDMGLCGSYNANVFRLFEQIVQPDDHVVMVGSKGCAWARSREIDLEDAAEDLSKDGAYDWFSQVVEKALHLFMNEQISAVRILYTHYKNTLTFEPRLETVLPAAKKETEEKPSRALTIYEPGEEEMLKEVLPLAAKSLVYSRYLESRTSEQASRRMAMEAATDNADELKDELTLAYNQARQSAITNEIIDIVGGANALS